MFSKTHSDRSTRATTTTCRPKTLWPSRAAGFLTGKSVGRAQRVVRSGGSNGFLRLANEADDYENTTLTTNTTSVYKSALFFFSPIKTHDNDDDTARARCDCNSATETTVGHAFTTGCTSRRRRRRQTSPSLDPCAIRRLSGRRRRPTATEPAQVSRRRRSRDAFSSRLCCAYGNRSFPALVRRLSDWNRND